MTETTPCQHCGTNLEFDIENANEFIACPNCAEQTRLLLKTQKKSASPRKGKLSSTDFWLLVIVAPLVLFGFVILIVYARESGSGAEIAKFLGEGLACCLCVLIGWFVLAHIVGVLTLLFVLVGVFLIISGISDMVEVHTATEATVFQQIYALHEFVGGALVFCAAMILHVLRTRLNPQAKSCETKDT